MRNYRKTTAVRAVRAARKDGERQMREKLTTIFELLGYRELNGVTAAQIVRDAL